MRSTTVMLTVELPDDPDAALERIKRLKVVVIEADTCVEIASYPLMTLPVASAPTFLERRRQ